MTAKYISKQSTLRLLRMLAMEVDYLETIWIRKGYVSLSRSRAKDCVRMIRELRKRGLFL